MSANEQYPRKEIDVRIEELSFSQSPLRQFQIEVFFKLQLDQTNDVLAIVSLTIPARPGK